MVGASAQCAVPLTDLGILCFIAVRKALDAGSEFWGAALWNWGYVAMFGILGLGYRRFLYPGTGTDQGCLSFFRNAFFFF